MGMTGKKSAIAGLMLACLYLFVFLMVRPASADATEFGALEVTKPASELFNPAEDSAVLQARKIEGITENNNSKLGELAVADPSLLTTDADHPLGIPRSATTDPAGVAHFDGLDVGVYQISEASRHVGNQAVTHIQPFLVYIYRGQTTRVQAKTQAPSILKSASVTQASPGQEVRFKISTDLPPTDKSGKLYQYSVFDSLDGRLEFREIEFAEIRNATGQFALSEDDFHISQHGNTVVFSLTRAGLQKISKLRKGHPEASLSFELKTFVRESADISSPIYNSAKFSPDGYCLPSFSKESSEPSEEGCDGLPGPLESEKVSVFLRNGNVPHTPSPGDNKGKNNSNRGWLGNFFPRPDSSDENSDQSEAPGRQAQNTQQSDHSGGEQSSGFLGGLAETGANIIGLFGLAVLAIFIGILLLRRRESDGEENE